MTKFVRLLEVSRFMAMQTAQVRGCQFLSNEAKELKVCSRRKLDEFRKPRNETSFVANAWNE